MIRGAVVWILAFVCLGAIVLMPLAELGLFNDSGNIPGFSVEMLKWLGMGELVERVADLRQLATDTVDRVSPDNPSFPYYVYSLILGVVMIVAAVAINLIGRLESEEKTVLPVKK